MIKMLSLGLYKSEGGWLYKARSTHAPNIMYNMRIVTLNILLATSKPQTIMDHQPLTKVRGVLLPSLTSAR
jgi:hypothetical protein